MGLLVNKLLKTENGNFSNSIAAVQKIQGTTGESKDFAGSIINAIRSNSNNENAENNNNNGNENNNYNDNIIMIENQNG